ncbi:uncharacterized protein N7511_001306 [Penicillium nucicola]|uniref:uncharacterized protein n=1 Tax=Penicillium nucicola TaxID=1850975 RepID=UPI002544E186|nr:uncharacterized protein N7511_001306 [Penicillium nucicola]KAJ5776295.1 hypothetical protein N7511_001306 [Penicillium nucicola]
MAVGLRSELSIPVHQRNNTAKGAWSTASEMEGDSEETVVGNKARHEVSCDQAVQNATPSHSRRRRLLLSTDSAFADTVLPSFIHNPNIELRLITDEPSALLTGTNKIPHYMDTVDSQTFDKKTGARKWLKAKTAELCEWADMLLVAPIDAGALGAMLAGLTNTLTLALLRGWVSKKPVVLIPGMTVSEWDHPLSSRQLGEIGRYWPWVCIVKPVLWKSNGPEELTILPWDGLKELHETLETTLKLPPRAFNLTGPSINGNLTATKTASTTACVPLASASGTSCALRSIPKSEGNAHFLPLEIWLSVFEDQLGDWETAKAVGIPSNLPVPQEWQNHLLKMSTPASLEYTMLRGSFAAIKKRIDALPRWKPLSDLACHLIVKFSRTDILSYLTENHLDLLWTTSRLTNIPYRASAIYGNPKVLTWWRDAPALPNKEYMADAMDGASRAGYLHVLDWWLHSGLPLRYSERALEAASAEGRIDVLDWWKAASANAPAHSPVPLKPGKSVLLAAQSGRTASLAWWDASGIPYSHAENVARISSTHGHVHVLQFWYQLKGPKMIFDNQVLVGPTKNGHDHVLQWWKTCGMRVEFKTCDIEEALEDADPTSGAEGRVRLWWERNGLNLGVGTTRCTLQRVLRGSNARLIHVRPSQPRIPSRNILSNNIHTTSKRPNITHHALLKNTQMRRLATAAIPSILVPPLIFIGLLLGLWTWKCFWIIVMQNKLLYISWLPPFTRSEVISEYEAQCSPVKWKESQIRSLDGTKLTVCEGRIPSKLEDHGHASTLKAQNQEITKSGKRRLVIICYFQGNGGSTPMRLPLLSQVLRSITEASKPTTKAKSESAETEYRIVALSYRGYWTSSGRATQSGIEMDAQAFLSWVSETYAAPNTDLELVLWGHSLGAAVASTATATYLPRFEDSLSRTSETSSGRLLSPVSRLILEAPTSSIKDMLIALYPQKWLPYRYMWPFSWNTWDIMAKMREIAAWRDHDTNLASSENWTSSAVVPLPRTIPPIFLLVVEKDEVIPAYVPDQLENQAKSLGMHIYRKDVLGAMHTEGPQKLDGRKALVQFIIHGTSTLKNISHE